MKNESVWRYPLIVSQCTRRNVADSISPIDPHSSPLIFNLPSKEVPHPKNLGGGLSLGVADGARTRDTQDHNLVLYQLNYSHHRRCISSENNHSLPSYFYKNRW